MHLLHRAAVAVQVTIRQLLQYVCFSGETRRVEVIVLAGRADEPYRGQYVKSYRLLYSSDGASFTQYQEIQGIDKVIYNTIMLILLKTYGFVMM